MPPQKQQYSCNVMLPRLQAIQASKVLEFGEYRRKSEFECNATTCLLLSVGANLSSRHGVWPFETISKDILPMLNQNL